MIVFCAGVALALSLGWGIRGNFGHEYGAMIPGALAAMAGALLSPRPDWHRRTASFGLFGALGWSLGGSISYMQVIAVGSITAAWGTKQAVFGNAFVGHAGQHVRFGPNATTGR